MRLCAVNNKFLVCVMACIVDFLFVLAVLNREEVDFFEGWFKILSIDYFFSSTTRKLIF